MSRRHARRHCKRHKRRPSLSSLSFLTVLSRASTIATRRLPIQILPKEVVIDLRYESLTALEQKLEASVGTNHHVPTKKQQSERSRNMC
jgi:hypothetical protein